MLGKHSYLNFIQCLFPFGRVIILPLHKGLVTATITRTRKKTTSVILHCSIWFLNFTLCLTKSLYHLSCLKANRNVVNLYPKRNFVESKVSSWSIIRIAGVLYHIIYLKILKHLFLKKKKDSKTSNKIIKNYRYIHYKFKIYIINDQFNY